MPDANPLVSLPDTDRQYHIDLAPGEVADYILLPGDPDRTDRIAAMLDDVEVHRRHREFNSVTGTHRGLRISVVATGIGTDNVEIVIAELLALVERPTLMRIGSCGVLRDDITLGDLVITTGAVRLESTTSFYVEDGYPAVADYSSCRRVGRSRRPDWPDRTCRHHRDGAGLLWRTGSTHPAAAAALPGPGRTHGRAGGPEFRDGSLGGVGPGWPGRLSRRCRLYRVRAAHQR